MTNSPTPTWADREDLIFWLGACLHNAERYLGAERESCAPFGKTKASPEERMEWQERRQTNSRLARLHKYHFAMSLGSLLRRLEQLVPLFPSVQPSYDAAQHLRKEGRLLRNMIEHADKNLESAARGKPRGGFVRKTSAAGDVFPGDKPGMADATGVIIDAKGHWLGGHLNVEWVVAELRWMLKAAQASPLPPNPLD
jgi:hypothetical protein